LRGVFRPPLPGTCPSASDITAPSPAGQQPGVTGEGGSLVEQPGLPDSLIHAASLRARADPDAILRPSLSVGDVRAREAAHAIASGVSAETSASNSLCASVLDVETSS